MDMSQAERQVMRVVWAYPRSRSQEIIAHLAEDFEWKPATIKTLLNRLKEKEFLKMDKIDGKYYYEALISEEEQVALDSQTLLKNICNTKHDKILYHLIENTNLTQLAIDDLRNLLEVKRQTAPRHIVCTCPPGQCRCGENCCSEKSSSCSCDSSTCSCGDNCTCPSGQCSCGQSCCTADSSSCACQSGVCSCGDNCTCSYGQCSCS